MLSYFAANLSKTPHINFYQNRSSIVEVMIKNLVCFLCLTVYYRYVNADYVLTCINVVGFRIWGVATSCNRKTASPFSSSVRIGRQRKQPLWGTICYLAVSVSCQYFIFLSLCPPSERSEWRRYCFRSMRVCVCLCVRAADRSISTFKRLKLRTSNLTNAFPGTVQAWPLIFFKNGAWPWSRDPLIFLGVKC